MLAKTRNESLGITGYGSWSRITAPGRYSEHAPSCACENSVSGDILPSKAKMLADKLLVMLIVSGQTTKRVVRVV